MCARCPPNCSFTRPFIQPFASHSPAILQTFAGHLEDIRSSPWLHRSRLRHKDVCQTFLSHQHSTLSAIIVPLLIVDGSNMSVWSISNVYEGRAPVFSPYTNESGEMRCGIVWNRGSISTGRKSICC